MKNILIVITLALLSLSAWAGSTKWQAIPDGVVHDANDPSTEFTSCSRDGAEDGSVCQVLETTNSGTWVTFWSGGGTACPAGSYGYINTNTMVGHDIVADMDCASDSYDMKLTKKDGKYYYNILDGKTVIATGPLQ